MHKKIARWIWDNIEGWSFDKSGLEKSFIEFCKENDIKYELFTWIDDDWD